MSRTCSEFTVPCRAVRIALAAVLLAGFSVAGYAEPATASPHATAASPTSRVSADSTKPSEPVVIDGGNGVTVTVDPETEHLEMTTPTPFVYESLIWGVYPREWDGPARDRLDLGQGWTLGEHFVQSRGGMAYYFPGLGLFQVDPTLPTGLAGYPGDDVYADAYTPGILVGRGDVPDREFASRLFHLDTGAVEYFSGEGNLIARVEADGTRSDWVYNDWDEPMPESIVDERGGTTRIELVEHADYRVTYPDGRVTVVEVEGVSPYRMITGFETRDGETLLRSIPVPGWPRWAGEQYDATVSRLYGEDQRTQLRFWWTEFPDRWNPFPHHTVDRITRNDYQVFPVWTNPGT